MGEFDLDEGVRAVGGGIEAVNGGEVGAGFQGVDDGGDEGVDGGQAGGFG